MAHRNNSIQPMTGVSGSGARQGGTRSTRMAFVIGAVVLAVLLLAWYDGGEEPIRPITQDIAVPEGQ